jgi:hypothetical protein
VIEEHGWAREAVEAFRVAGNHVKARRAVLYEELAQLEAQLVVSIAHVNDLEAAERTLVRLLAAARQREEDALSPGMDGRNPVAGSTRCERIIQIVERYPDRVWRPREIAECLGEVGKLDSVRSTMQYLARTGRLFRTPESTYRPSTASRSLSPTP